MLKSNDPFHISSGTTCSTWKVCRTAAIIYPVVEKDRQVYGMRWISLYKFEIKQRITLPFHILHISAKVQRIPEVFVR